MKNWNKKATYLTIGTLLLNIFLITWLRGEIIHYGYEIAEKNEEVKKLSEVNRNLKIELEKLKNPERLKNIAEKNLNLKIAGKDELFVFSRKK